MTDTEFCRGCGHQEEDHLGLCVRYYCLCKKFQTVAAESEEIEK